MTFVGRFLFALAASRVVSDRARAALLRRLGLSLGHVHVRHGLDAGRSLRVGDGSFIGVGCYFEHTAPVVIGRNVAIGSRLSVHTSSHDRGDAPRRAGERWVAPVTIEDGCWLGGNVTVLPGVTIGAGCVIAAGAVVTRDCEPHGQYAGVPARRIKELGQRSGREGVEVEPA